MESNTNPSIDGQATTGNKNYLEEQYEKISGLLDRFEKLKELEAKKSVNRRCTHDSQIMNEICEFKVGDWVTTRHPFDFADNSPPGTQANLRALGDPMIVNERLVQECPGGIQIHYKVQRISRGVFNGESSHPAEGSFLEHSLRRWTEEDAPPKSDNSKPNWEPEDAVMQGLRTQAKLTGNQRKITDLMDRLTQCLERTTTEGSTGQYATGGVVRSPAHSFAPSDEVKERIEELAKKAAKEEHEKAMPSSGGGFGENVRQSTLRVKEEENEQQQNLQAQQVPPIPVEHDLNQPSPPPPIQPEEAPTPTIDEAPVEQPLPVADAVTGEQGEGESESKDGSKENAATTNEEAQSS